MMKKGEVPKELVDKVYQLLEEAKSTGKIRKGANEATKAIEKGQAKLIVIAEDVNPPEVTMHLPLLADEKQIPYIYVPSRSELGAAGGMAVSTSAIAVLDAGEGFKQLKMILESIKALEGKPAKEAPKKEEKPAEKKPEVKKEAPKKEEKPAEKPKEEKKPEAKKEAK
jgi:large subunit ribosomal protein L7Ae